MHFIAQVEAVQHFLFGIAIDEGFKDPQANTLAWDVLYTEAHIHVKMAKLFEVANRNLMITLLQRMNHSPETCIVRRISYLLYIKPLDLMS